MATVGVHEAKTQFSKLLRRVAMGEEITITRSGQPVARLVRPEPTTERVFGGDRGLYQVPEDFDDPLPDELLQGFQGR